MEQDYEHDIFISYRRKQPVIDWMKYHFHPLLEERLPECLSYPPKIYIDSNIETGADWPASLRQALKRSRCLVAIWSAEYFRSPWCLAEWHTMMERERLVGLRSDETPSGLIYPVKFSDGEHFPEIAKNTQYKNLEKWNSKYESFKQTVHIIELEREMQNVCDEIAKTLKRCPSWQDWPVITPNETQPLDFPVPRMR